MKREAKENLIWQRTFLILFFLLLALFLFRLLSARHLDDVHPNIQCDEELLLKSDIFYVIPIFENKSIANDSLWCSKILSYNKTLALHGVYHTYREFETPRSEEYIETGEIEFEKCFGFKPIRFKAPQITLSNYNEEALVKMGYKIDSKFKDLFHKVYHCSDQGKFPNLVSDLI